MKSTLASFLLRLVALIVAVSPLAHADKPFKSGYAIVHDGSSVYYEVHGTGHRYLMMGFQLQPNLPDVQAFVEGLGSDYKLIFATYPPGEFNQNWEEAKLYTFTPAAVTRDYLQIATAAGADEFAFYGYSWGAVCGLQLAIRSDRIKALVAGGFPMMNGPYPDILRTMRGIVFEHNKSHHSPEAARQMLTYYESLQSFDDRSIQSRLKIPRVNFVGARDRVIFPGGVDVDFYGKFSESRNELQAAGWDVITVPGKDHETARAPEVVVPLLRKWLNEHWPANQR